MAMDSNNLNSSRKRCRPPSRSRQSSPVFRSSRNKGKPSRKSLFIVRSHRLDDHCTNERMRSMRENRRHKRKTEAERSIRRSYDKHSESNVSGDNSKYREFISKKDKFDRCKNDSSPNSRYIRGIHRYKTYENRRDTRENGRHLSRSSRERSRSRERIRHEESYDDRESYRSFARMPMTLPKVYENEERRVLYPRSVRGPPMPLAVPPPTRILLPPRLVPHVPHMRLSFPPRVIPAPVRPVVLAPVVILRAPMIPLRPQIQASGLCN